MVLYKLTKLTFLDMVTQCNLLCKRHIRGTYNQCCMHVGLKPTYYGPKLKTLHVYVREQEVICKRARERGRVTKNRGKYKLHLQYGNNIPIFKYKLS